MDKRFLRFGFSLCFCALFLGCAGIPKVSKEEVILGEAVLAIRLSPQINVINRGATGGYLVLVDAAGQAQAVNIGELDLSKIVWTETGIFVGGNREEYLLGENGLIVHPRGSDEAYETARFVRADGEGFISIYNVGFGEGLYRQRVTVGDAESVTFWDVTGMFESVIQCGDLVVGITDLAATDLVSYAPGERNPRIDALIQLYPKPVNKEAALLASLPIEKGIFDSSLTPYTGCVSGVSYTYAQYYDGDEDLNPELVLRSWDTRTGEHGVIPLITESGMPFVEMTIDDNIMAMPSRVISDKFYAVSDYGRVVVVDITTGVAKEIFQVENSNPKVRDTQSTFTDKSIFVLDSSQDYSVPLELSRYDLTTGERTKLITITGTESIRKPFDMILKSIALNPAWIKTLEQSGSLKVR